MHFPAALTVALYALSSASTLPDKPGRPSQSLRDTLEFSYSPNITRVTINHPPVNLLDAALCGDLRDFLISIQPDSSVQKTGFAPPKVVVFDSAVPDFFVNHIDLNQVLLPFTPEKDAFSSTIFDVFSFLRNTTSTVFIAEVNGNAIGGGNEFTIQTDIRFAGPRARSAQLETTLAAVPGGGGLQALPRLMNRARALQYILSGDSIDGPTGVRLGIYNEYFPDEKQLREEVDRLAKRIALNSAGGLNGTKARTLSLYPPPQAYVDDVSLFTQLVNDPESQMLVKRAIELGDNQTNNAFERGLDETLLELFG